MKRYLDDRARLTPVADLARRNLTRFEDWQHEFRAELLRRWGLLSHLNSSERAPDVNVMGSITREEYTLERIWFYSTPGLLVTGNLYIPHGLSKPAPAMVYLCGHHVKQKVHYQQHARHFAQLGFVTLILDTLLHGEAPGSHRGTHSEGSFHWISRGYSPAAVEALNTIRGVDVLLARQDVNSNAVGVTGHSGGGAVSWWAAALDPRIAALASSTGTGSWGEHVRSRTIDTHCDCYFPPLRAGESVEDIYALVAPRPALIAAPRQDHVYHPAGVGRSYSTLAEIYQVCGAPGNLRLLSFDAPHQYTRQSRREIFQWFSSHLAGRTPPQITDVDGHQEPEENLVVFPDNILVPENKNDSVADWFFTSRSERDDIRNRLWAECFNHSPAVAPHEYTHLRSYIRQEWHISDFQVNNGDGWHLNATLLQTSPSSMHEDEIAVVLRAPHECGPFWETTIPLSSTTARLICHVRGTGDTAWHPSQNWHLRRAAALLGTSIAALQAWDAYSFLTFTKRLFPTAKITVHAQGDLTIGALLAAVLEGDQTNLCLYGLPSTFDRPSSPAGDDFVVEVPGILQVGDVPDLLSAVRGQVDVKPELAA